VSFETLLAQAIRARQIVDLDYEGTGSRKMELYVLYRSSEGQLLLNGSQLSGQSAHGEPLGWKTFLVERLTDVVLFSETFTPRVDYHPAHFASIVVMV
jgi:hypothetical protein